jgi:F1F0 ATPase subunit 2
MHWLILVTSFLAGLVIGVLYFGGLWLTTRRLATARHPIRLLAASFLFRVLVLLLAIYFITLGRWERLLAFLCGVVLVRMVMTWKARPKQQTATRV